MKADHKIVKTEDPDSLNPCQIVSRPAGNCPYYLVSLPEGRVAELTLQNDIVEDTAVFFGNYDLSEPDEDEEMI